MPESLRAAKMKSNDDVDNLKKMTDKAQELMSYKDEDKLEDVKGRDQKGKMFKATRSGKFYSAIPCSLNQIPQLVEYVKKIDQILSNNHDANPVDVLTSKDGEALKCMGKIIELTFDGQVDLDIAMNEFSLGDFPKLYKIALDLNDFLSGMRTIYQ